MGKTPKKTERKKALKVFRTPIGFHDAYVAAPSQKAALEAWGAEGNLFAQGIAEQVTDPALMEEPLASPGKIIRKLRGSEADHVKALGDPKASKQKAKTAPKARPKGPRPSRAELERAEHELAVAEKRQRSELRELELKMEKLERDRRVLQRRHESERDKLAEALDRERSRYARLVRKWDG